MSSAVACAQLRPAGPQRRAAHQAQWFQPAGWGSGSPQPLRRRNPVAHAAVISSEQTALEGFLAGQGVDLANAAVAVGPGGGLVAARPVGRGEQLFAVPEVAWVTPDTVRRSDLGPAVAGLEPWLAMTLWVLHERGKPASRWSPYLRSWVAAPLAGAPGSPLLWSEAELALLEGTQLLASTRAYRCGCRVGLQVRVQGQGGWVGGGRGRGREGWWQISGKLWGESRWVHALQRGGLMG